MVTTLTTQAFQIQKKPPELSPSQSGMPPIQTGFLCKHEQFSAVLVFLWSRIGPNGYFARFLLTAGSFCDDTFVNRPRLSGNMNKMDL